MRSSGGSESYTSGGNNTPYTWFWVGPLLLEVPAKVLGLIDDMWNHKVADVGITGRDKGQGGKYLLLPPDYKGDVPEGYFVVGPKTFDHAFRFFAFTGSFVDTGN